MDQKKSLPCFGMLQVFPRTGSAPLFILMFCIGTTLLLVGCMPATRVSHAGNSQAVRTSQNALESALTDQGLEARERRLLIASSEWLGTPYSYGGTSTNGIDCSAFVREVFRVTGTTLPRTSAQQAEEGREIPREAIRPGDLLFFNTSGSGVSHVGISIGGNEFIHASSSRGVIVSSLSEDYYRERLLFARRVN